MDTDAEFFINGDCGRQWGGGGVFFAAETVMYPGL